MKTVRKLLFREVFLAVTAVTLAFVSLFFFFDFVDELQAVGRANVLGYSVAQALVYVALMVPSHVYELLPITVLIGTIFVMARLANSSEFTILRTSGLGPWSALRLLLGMGLVMVLSASPWSSPSSVSSNSATRSTWLRQSARRGKLSTNQFRLVVTWPKAELICISTPSVMAPAK